MARLGTDKNPISVRVNCKAHALAIYAMCEDRDWAVMIEVDERKTEDLSDLHERINMATGPNDACLCRSGKKFKKCCGPTTAVWKWKRSGAPLN